MVDDADVCAHPRMNVALHRDHHFSLSELFHFRLALRRLRFVPFAIHSRQRMNIMNGGVAVLESHWLIDHHSQYSRSIDAPILIQNGRRGWYRPCSLREPGFHPDEGIL